MINLLADNSRWFIRGLAIFCLLLILAIGLEADQRASLRPRRFDAARAYRDLIKQGKFGPRVPGSAGHKLCGDWLRDQLAANADSVREQRFNVQAAGRELQLRNIVATFNPAGKRHILLCAHWDTRPMADADPNPKNRTKSILGANDGASGVAVLLELARTLKANPPRQRVTIVLFDGEDYGMDENDMLLGSRYFASIYNGPRVDWAVLLDMVGERGLQLKQEQNSLKYAPQVMEKVWRAAEKDTEGRKVFVQKPGASLLDDHIPLLAKGIPCIDVIDFDYPYWHTLGDTPDKCSPSSLGVVGRILLRAMEEDR